MTEIEKSLRLEQENERLLKENAELRSALEELHWKASEPDQVIRAIQQGEIDALVVHEEGQEQVYSLQRFDSVYRSMVEQCFPYGVWLAKPDGTLLYVSPSFLDLLQTDLQEMRQKGQFHFLSPETSEAIEKEWAKCRERGGILNVEYTVRLHDGSERTIWTQGVLAQPHDGRPHWVGVNIDVTERKQTADELKRQAEELRKSEARYRATEERLVAALSASATGTFRWDPETGIFLDIDESLRNLLGLTPRDPFETAEDFANRVHPEDRAKWFAAVEGCRLGKNLDIEFRIPLSKGKIRWLYGRAKIIRDSKSRPTSLVGACIDITDRKQIEEALKEADRRKDEFLAMLAHELRNPLAPIRSGLDILEMEAGGDPQIVKLMQEQVEHLVRLVDDLLDVGRIMRGRIELRKEPVQLATLINQSVTTVRTMIDSQEQELIVHMPEEPIWLNADPVRIVQVIENLLNNASKYTQAKGRIELLAEREEDRVLISVEDTGTGIDPELLPKVFDLFTQSSRSLDRAQGGLGIGLTLVQRLVEMHEGSVSVHSDGPGHGSTFTVWLPVIETAELEEKGMEAAHIPHRRRILIVDDNVTAARMFSALLGKLGDHNIDIAHDGPSALARFQETRPEIVLMDIGLPGMDGYQLGQAIRDAGGANILLVALTGYGQEEDRQKSKDAGFDEHLVKPPSIEQIREILIHSKLTAASSR